MNTFSKILIFTLVVFLTACGTTQQVVVTKTVYKASEIPDTLLMKCTATPPPDKEEFLKLSDQDKKKSLMLLSIKLYGDIESCNGRIRAISDFQEKERKSIDEINKEASK